MRKELSENKRIAQQLDNMLASDRMVHAVLFSGGSYDSRNEIANYLAEKILCIDDVSSRKFEHNNHEDFIVTEKADDRESITVSQIEELTKRIQYKPYGSCYVVLIKDAHLMRTEAQNKLLKTLEEPLSEAVIILLSESTDAILPTVQSRCISFILEETKTQASDSIDAAAELFLRLIKSKAPYYKKKTVLSDILSDKDNSRGKALEFLDVLEQKLEMELLSGECDVDLLAQAVKQAESGRQYLKQLHSVAYTMKQICLRV